MIMFARIFVFRATAAVAPLLQTFGRIARTHPSSKPRLSSSCEGLQKIISSHPYRVTLLTTLLIYIYIQTIDHTKSCNCFDRYSLKGLSLPQGVKRAIFLNFGFWVSEV